MAWSKVQDNVQAAGTGTSASLAYPVNVTAGNLLLILININTTSNSFSISDTIGNTWLKVLPEHGNTLGVAQTLVGFAAYNKTIGANTISLSWTTSSVNSGDVVLSEWSGISTGLTQDGTAVTHDNTSNTGSNGRAITLPTYTPTVTGDLVVSMYGTSDAYTSTNIGTPWTMGDYGFGTGSTMTRTGGMWGWTTGALAAISANATDNNSAWLDAAVFGIQATGAAASSPIPLVCAPVLQAVNRASTY